MHNTRSRAFVAGLLGVTTAFAVACSSSGGSTGAGTSNNPGTTGTTQSGSSTGSSEPLRLGLLTPSSGTYAAYGALERAGVQYAVDQANAAGGVDGHKVEISKADTAGTAAGAVTGAQKLVEQDHVSFLTGTVATPVSLAVSQKLSSLDALMVGTTSQGVDLTGKSCNPLFFEANANDGMAINTINPWLAEQPQKSGTWDVIAADYEYGHDSVAAFKTALQQYGGKIDKALYAPLGTTDFGTYLGQLKGADGLLIVESGTDIIDFYKQAFQFGTLKNYKAVISSAGGLSAATLSGVGSKIAGQLGATLWSASVPTPESKAFVSGYEQANNGTVPGQFAANAYTGAELLFAAVKAAHSVDPQAVAKAMAGLSFDSLFGNVTMRAADHQLLVPTYISQVVDSGGKLGLKVLTTLPASQTTPQPNSACHLS